MSVTAMLGVLAFIVALFVALDPLFAPKDPGARQRRAWYKTRLAQRRGERV